MAAATPRVRLCARRFVARVRCRDAPRAFLMAGPFAVTQLRLWRAGKTGGGRPGARAVGRARARRAPPAPVDHRRRRAAAAPLGAREQSDVERGAAATGRRRARGRRDAFAAGGGMSRSWRHAVRSLRRAVRLLVADLAVAAGA